MLGGLDSRSDQAAAGHTPAETEALARAWGADALAWWKTTFPHSVLLAAALHLDKSTPHMHVVAVIRDLRGRVGMTAALPEGAGRPGYTGSGTIIRYSPRGKAKMQTAIHDSYIEGVGRIYGMERGENRRRGRQGEFRRPSENIARVKREQERRARGIQAERQRVERQALQVDRDLEAAAAEREAAGRALREARSKANRILRGLRVIVRDTARAFGQALRAGSWGEAAFLSSVQCREFPRAEPRRAAARSGQGVDRVILAVSKLVHGDWASAGGDSRGVRGCRNLAQLVRHSQGNVQDHTSERHQKKNPRRGP